MASKFFVPTASAEDWKHLLKEPEKQWVKGYSARALAYCWQGANSFPADVRRVFRKSQLDLFQDVRFLFAFPEHKVALPGGATASQSDIFVLAKGNNQLISIAVEGKASEPFGDGTVAEWKVKNGGGKGERLPFLCGVLGLEETRLEHIRYQLLHRTASAVIEAENFNARNAMMLVHSFSQSYQWFDDYCQFLALFGIKTRKDALKDSVVYGKNVKGTRLYFGWVKGNPRFLKV
jgi:hypothetical protein